MGNVCHRIDQNDVIKVADFGLSEHIYRSGYYCQSKEDVVAREEKVPIWWMAPESIESCRYSEKTDVVSTHTHTDTHVLHMFVKHICHNNKQLVKCYLSLNAVWVPAYNDVDKALLLLPFFLISNTYYPSTQTLLNSLCNRDFGRFVAMIHYISFNFFCKKPMCAIIYTLCFCPRSIEKIKIIVCVMCLQWSF